EELSDFLESREKSGPFAHDYDDQQQRNRQRREFEEDDYDFRRGQGESSSIYHGGYELLQRRLLRPNEQDDENEKDPENDPFLQKLRKINETRRTIAADEERLAAMEQSLREREINLRRSMMEQEQRLENELRESIERNTKREQELTALHQQQLQMSQSAEIYRNPFASNEPLIKDYNDNDSQHSHTQAQQATPAPDISSRAANAILRHDLSGNHQENINPFEDPSLLLEASSSSARSSVHGSDDIDTFADADERSVTVHEDDEWTEAELGSIVSEESDESWGSTSAR
ncbi:hypothetical protein BGZ46_003434, partial [Entomortierella lignicola]